MNARQTKYVAKRLAGKSQKASYVAAGYKARGKTAERAACRLEAMPEIAAALGLAKAEVIEAAVDASVTGVPYLVKQLEEIVNPESHHKVAARLAAIRMLGDHFGMWAPKKIDISTPAQLIIIEEIVDGVG